MRCNQSRVSEVRDAAPQPGAAVGILIAVFRLLTFGREPWVWIQEWTKRISSLGSLPPVLTRPIQPEFDLDNNRILFRFDAKALAGEVFASHMSFVQTQAAAMEKTASNEESHRRLKAQESLVKSAMRMVPGLVRFWAAVVPNGESEPVVQPGEIAKAATLWWGDQFEAVEEDEDALNQVLDGIRKQCPHFDPPSRELFLKRVDRELGVPFSPQPF